MNVYVSTSCLANRGSLLDTLDTYAGIGLRCVELGVWRKYIDGLSPELLQRGINLLVHHYFPPPREPFIVNLASQDATILKRSRQQVKKSIDFCQSLGIPLFTFHAGYRTDPDNNIRFLTHSVFPYEVAFNTFVESVKEVNDYAQERGIRIAVENNALYEKHIVDGQNLFLLFCQADEFHRLWEKIPSSNLGMLLDLGHLRVTSHWLGFDRRRFVDSVKDRVFAIHIHDNDGKADMHRALDETSWCLEVIGREEFGNIPVTLESWGLTAKQIVRQVRLIEKALGGDAPPKSASAEHCGGT